MAWPSVTFIPGKDQTPIVQEAGWATGPALMCVENLGPTWVQTLNRPACSKSLCYICYYSSQKEAHATHKHVLYINVLSLLSAEYLSVDSVVKWRLQNVAGNQADCEKGAKACLNL